MAKKKYKNTLSCRGRMFTGGGDLDGGWIDSSQVTAKPDKSNNSGDAMGTIGQIGGFIGMFDSLAQMGTNAFDSARAGTANKPTVLTEGVLGGQTGSHLANMWNTGKKTAAAIDYVNSQGNIDFAATDSANLLAQHAAVAPMENLNINTRGKEWEDAIFDPISYITTRWILGTRETAAERQRRINEAINAVNTRQEASYANAVNNFQKNQARNVMANYSAFGGPLFGYMNDGAIAYDMARDNLAIKMMNAQGKGQGTVASAFANGGLLSDNFTNGVTMVGAGGTHEENPYSGVPMGVAEDGQPNLVEEGEAIYNDYVFSNRLKVPEAIRSKYKLRGPKKMTYAEAFLNAQKESQERENDPISKNGLDNIAMVLAQSQEEVKAEKEARKKAHGGHLFATGSAFDDPPFDIGSMTPEEFYRINQYWPEGYDPTTGQWNVLGDSNWTPEKLVSVSGSPIGMVDASGAPVVPSGAPAATTTKKPAVAATTPPPAGNGTGEVSLLSNDINGLRLMPILGNLGAVASDAFGWTNNPYHYNFISNYTPVDFSPLGNYIPIAHNDTRYNSNRLAQQAAAARAAILNTTTPNKYANLMNADYLAQVAQGDMLIKDAAAEYDNLIKGSTFNRATDEYNSEMAVKARSADNQERLAYEQAKLAEAKANVDETNTSMGARGYNIKALTESLGKLGKEIDSRDMIKWLAVKGVLGNYSEADLRGMGIDESTIKDIKKDKYVGTKAANGGKLRKKRGGFTY